MKHALVMVIALAACGGGAAKKSTQTMPRDGLRPGGVGGEPSGGEPGGGGEGGCRADPNDPLGSCTPGGKGVIEEGELSAVGAIDKAVVRRVVREHFEALRYCYEATLLANPEIAGTVIAKFTIQIDGTVHDVTASGVHPDVETCIATKVSSFRFPKPDGAKVEVAYPFTFKPS